jgi:hypothetical protein
MRDVLQPKDELGKSHNLLSINAFKVQGVDFEFIRWGEGHAFMDDSIGLRGAPIVLRCREPLTP